MAPTKVADAKMLGKLAENLRNSVCKLQQIPHLGAEDDLTNLEAA